MTSQGPDGALWITDSYNSQILRMTTDGTFTSFPLARSPTSITVGPDKALWFTENTDGSVIGRITTKGVIETYGAQGGVEGWGGRTRDRGRDAHQPGGKITHDLRGVRGGGARDPGGRGGGGGGLF